MEYEHIKKCMIIILNKFSNVNFFKNPESLKLKQIKDYKTIFEHNNEKYIVNTIDYVYNYIQTITNLTVKYKISSIGDSIYLDIHKNLLNEKNITSFINYGRTISLKKEGLDFIIKEDINGNEFNVLYNNSFSFDFLDFTKELLHQLFDNNLKFISILFRVKYQTGNHSEILFFQLIKNDIYIIHYDPSINTNLPPDMKEFIYYLKVGINFLLEKNNNKLNLKIIHKEDLYFENKDRKIGGLQRMTLNLKYVEGDSGSPSDGICELFSFFLLYFVIFIIYSTKTVYLISDLIKQIESIIFHEYFQNIDSVKKLSNIIINFSNHVKDNYYEYSISKILSYSNSFDDKKKFLDSITKIFNGILASEIEKNIIKIVKYENIDSNYLKSSGYLCKENIDCSSNNCVNNHCYIDEKEVNINDIRSVGNPCLYNIQCRSGDCRDYVCIGEDKYEKEDNYDTAYDEDEIIEYEDDLEILDNENQNIYENM